MSLFPGCGGKVGEVSGDGDGDSAGDGDGSGATAAGGRAASGGGTTAVGGNAVASGGGHSGGGAGGTEGPGGSLGAGGNTWAVPDQCLLPLEGGNCDAYFVRYGYDRTTGRCMEFVYGGCGGNDNNFDTLEACNMACRNGVPGPEQRCETAAECKLIYKGCCGPCGGAAPDEFWAINVDYEHDGPWAQKSCAELVCGPCESTEPADVGVACENNTCVAFDTKRFARCDESDDCQVRYGSECCGCSDDGPWMAFSDVAGLEALVCEPIRSCRACAPEPGTVAAWCDDGICRLVSE